MFQQGGLFGSLTVAENVAWPLQEHTDLDDTVIDGIAALKIAMAGLEPQAAARYPSELSGGMVKRAALARALALDPQLLFLDEPTAGLDPQSAAGVDALVRELRDLFGLTIVIITHDLDLLWQVADRVAVLGAGRVQAVGSMAELAQLDNDAVRPFFAGARGRSARAAATPGEGDTRGRRAGGSMENKVNFALVGAFVLVLATALVGVVLWLASGGAYQTQYERYDASVEESVSGLNPKAPVKYNGVDVGKVERIWLDPENPQRVKLRFQIERGTPIKVDTVATLKTQGLTGIAYVELSGGTGRIAHADTRASASTIR